MRYLVILQLLNLIFILLLLLEFNVKHENSLRENFNKVNTGIHLITRVIKDQIIFCPLSRNFRVIAKPMSKYGHYDEGRRDVFGW